MDIVDTRDIISRIEELDDELSELQDEIEDLESDVEGVEFSKRHTDDIDQIQSYDDNIAELNEKIKDKKNYILNTLQPELDHLNETIDDVGSEAIRGVTLIHEDYFTDYVKDMLLDCGDIPQDLPWYIEDAIDWDRVATTLRQDYVSTTYDGEDYLFRS